MFNVIEYSNSVRDFGRWDFYSDIEKFDSLEDIFEKYIDIEMYKDWICKDVIELDDVLEMKDGIGVMSVNEDMSLYIFKSDELCNLLEDYVFDLEMKIKEVK